MPWKEPGDKPREPRRRGSWGSGSGGGQGSGPDLEAWLREARRRLGPFGRGPLGVVALLVLLLVLWFLIGGWTRVGGGELGVVSRFGRFESVLQPGLHAHFPSPIDQVTVVDVGHTRSVSDEARLLTRDAQLVLLDYAVQYKVTDVREFLFATRDAEEVVRSDAIAAARAAVGAHSAACLLEGFGLPCASGHVGDEQLAGALRDRLVALLAADGGPIGVSVVGVTVQGVGVPSDVKPAFDGIAKARDDAKTAASAAASDVARDKLRTKDQVAAIHAEAETHGSQAESAAKLAAARFDQALAQYQAAPQVTRQRLWLDAMQSVLTKNRVVLNTGTGSVIVQFPAHETPAAAPAPAGSAPASAASASASAPARASSTGAVPVTSGPIVRGIQG